MTTVQETLTIPGGAGPAYVKKCRVRVRLVADADTEAVGYGTATIGGVWEPVVDGSGQWSVVLEPTASLTPEGCVYEIVVTYPDRPAVTRYITVPASGTVDVVDYLTAAPSAVGTTVSAGAMIYDPSTAHSIDDDSLLVRDAIGDLSTDIATGWVPNATGAKYRRGYRAGEADALRGSGPLRIVGIGTSIMQGWSASTYDDYWFTIAQTRLATKLGLTGIGAGLVGCSEGFGYESGWTESGTISGNGTGMKQWGATIAVGGYIEQTFTCDRIIVHGCKQNFLRGAVEILIDGVVGGPNAVAGDGGTGKYQSYDGALAASAYGSAWSWDSGAMTAGSHTVRIRQATGTGGNYPGIVSEVMVFNGDHGTLEMWNAGHYGYSTAQYDTPTTSIGWAEWLQFIDPHAILVVHGVNDWGTGSAADVTAFETQLQSIVDYIEAKTDPVPSIILGVDQLVAGRDPDAWELFRLATYRVARANGCEVFDFDQLCGNMATTDDDVWTLMSGDQIHPANRGHYVMGHAVADWLGAFPLEASSGGAVDSVNGETGAVTLTAADIGSTPAGGISGNDVQEALDELDTDKLAKAGGTMTGQLVTTTGAALTPSVLVGSGAGVFNPSTDRLSLAIASGGTLAERWRFTYNQLIAYGGSNALPAYAHNLDAGTGFQPGLAGAGISITGTQVWAWSATGADAKSLRIANVADATAATDAVNRQFADARFQPIDSDLTAIAALTTTAYGRAVLELANQAALMALLSASSDTASGVVELATSTEVRTGTDTTRAVTPAGLAAVHPGSLLATKVHDPASTTTYTTTSATLGDVDSSNLAVTFTAPASGNVLVKLEARITDNSAADLTWGLRNGSSQAGGLFVLGKSQNFSGGYQVRTGQVYVSGLTPGTSYTYKFAWAISGGVTFSLQAGQTAGSEGAASMMVFSA